MPPLLGVVDSLGKLAFQFPSGVCYRFPHGNCKDLSSNEQLALLEVFSWPILCCSDCSIYFFLRLLCVKFYFYLFLLQFLPLLYFFRILYLSCVCRYYDHYCYCQGRVFNGTCMCTYIYFWHRISFFPWLCISPLFITSVVGYIKREKSLVFSKLSFFLCLSFLTFCLSLLAQLMFILS